MFKRKRSTSRKRTTSWKGRKSSFKKKSSVKRRSFSLKGRRKFHKFRRHGRSSGPASKRIFGTKQRHHFILSAKRAREHIKVHTVQKGKMTWSELNCIGAIINISSFEQYPLTGMFNESKIVALDSVTTFTGGEVTPATRFKFSYVSSVTANLKLSRQDHDDDSTTEVAFIPLTGAQVEQWNAYGGMTPTSVFNATPPPTVTDAKTAFTAWGNGMNHPFVKRKLMNGVMSGKQAVNLKQHFEVKHFVDMRFPKGSKTFWTEYNNNTGAVATAPTDVAYLAILLYNDGAGLSGNDVFDFELGLTWYMTYFFPTVPSLLPDPVLKTTGEAKEEKTDDPIIVDGLKDLVVTTPVGLPTRAGAASPIPIGLPLSVRSEAMGSKTLTALLAASVSKPKSRLQ